MHRCHILVEGQTEETFAKDVLLPHLYAHGFHGASVSILTTKVVASGKNHKGGISSYQQLRRELLELTSDQGCLVTTMIDLYGLPVETPGVGTATSNDPYERVQHIETALSDDIDRKGFIPHLMLHEFETLAYVDPTVVGARFDDNEIATTLTAERNAAGGPELVDDGPLTAPSKRIARHIPGYLKSTDGPVIAQQIGLPRLRAACPHFDGWLTTVEERVSPVR